MVPFDRPNFGVVFMSWNRNWFRRVDLNRHLQKPRFTFQALQEFDWRVWMDQLTLYMTSGKVMVALLQLPVSLWRDTCNYNGGDSVHRAQNFNGFTGPISRAVSVTTGSPKLLLRMWYDPIRSLCRLFFLAFVSWRTCSWNLKVTLTVAVSRGRRMVRVRSCCLNMFPGILDEIKIYSLPAYCSDLFSAPDRGSFGVSNSCALWRFGPPNEPSQLMCFLMPCIASKFHAMSVFLFRIYSDPIPNPI